MLDSTSMLTHLKHFILIPKFVDTSMLTHHGGNDSNYREASVPDALYPIRLSLTPLRVTKVAMGTKDRICCAQHNLLEGHLLND